LYTVPTGKSLYPAFVQVTCTSFTSGGKSQDCAAGAGGNASSYNDILQSQSIAVASTGTRLMKMRDDNTTPIYGAGAAIYFKVVVGSDATTETWRIDLIGFLV
jgi:hypothetical protein